MQDQAIEMVVKNGVKKWCRFELKPGPLRKGADWGGVEGRIAE